MFKRGPLSEKELQQNRLYSSEGVELPVVSNSSRSSTVQAHTSLKLSEFDEEKVFNAATSPSSPYKSGKQVVETNAFGFPVHTGKTPRFSLQMPMLSAKTKTSQSIKHDNVDNANANEGNKEALTLCSPSKVSWNDIIERLSLVETMIQRVLQRNHEKDIDKSFEASYFRVILIMLVTYVSIFGYLSFLNTPRPALNAIVPTIGFNLSTWSLNCKLSYCENDDHYCDLPYSP